MSLHRRVALVVLLLAVALPGVPAVSGATASTGQTAPDPQPEPLTAGDQYCRGQTLTVSIPNATGNETLILTKAINSEPVTRLTVDDGQAVVNTSGLNGTYVLRDGDNETLLTNESGVVVGQGNASNASLRVQPCAFDARFEHPIWLSTTRAILQVDPAFTETVWLDSSGIRDDVLAGMVDGTATDGGVRTTVPSDGRLPMVVTQRFICEAGAGEHDFTIASGDMNATARATLVVYPEYDAVSFVRIPVPTNGSQAVITIDGPDEKGPCWGESDVQLHIGSETSAFRLNTGIEDRDNDGRVVVRLNTSTLGVVPASAAMRADGIDTLRNPTVVTEYPSLPIPQGTYEVNLTDGSTEVAVSTLTIDRNRTITYPSPTPTTTRPAPPTAAPTTGPVPTATPTTQDGSSPATGTPTQDGESVETVATASDDGAGFGVTIALFAVMCVFWRTRL